MKVRKAKQHRMKTALQMKIDLRRNAPAVLLIALAALLLPGAALASATDGSIDAANFTSPLLDNASRLWTETTSNNLYWNAAAPHEVRVTDSGLTGYIWGDALGWVSLNCSNTASCAGSSFGVANDAEGNLSGYAWGEITGWMSFSCANPETDNCSMNDDARVIIGSDGEFSGYAWTENFGWVEFNCGAGSGSCVKTDWRPASSRASPGGIVAGSDIAGGSGSGPVLRQLPRSGPIPVFAEAEIITVAGEREIGAGVPRSASILPGQPPRGLFDVEAAALGTTYPFWKALLFLAALALLSAFAGFFLKLRSPKIQSFLLRSRYPIAMILLSFVATVSVLSAFAATGTPRPEILQSGTAVARSAAPGSSLPVTVKLINFGSDRKVDVTVAYSVLDTGGREVLSHSDTVAVETTLSFVKELPIPSDAAPGRYTVVVRLQYDSQEFPAKSEFTFEVERRILGIPERRFVPYLLLAIVLGAALGALTRFVAKRRRQSRLSPHDYPEVPAPARPFYEIVSDIIMQMRYKAGDKGLALASSIPGLSIGPDGRITDMKGDPAKIAADLIAAYRRELGVPVNFLFQKGRAKSLLK